MSTRLNCAIAAAVVASPVVFGAAPASAAAGKYPLVGPSAILLCHGLAPYPGDDASQVQDGFALFNVSEGMLSVVVSVKKATPNAQLLVRLLQSDGTDCYTFDGVINTNGQGYGTLRLQEPVTGSHAQVIVDTSFAYGNPTYRATDVYPIGMP